MQAEYIQTRPAGKAGRSVLRSVRPDIMVKGLMALLAVAYLSLGVGVAVQMRAAQSAAKDVGILRDTLAQTSVDMPAVETRLRTAQARRAAGVRLVPQRLLTSQVVDMAMAEARAARVEVRDVKAATMELEKVGDRVYEAHRYSMVARGDRAQVMDFLKRLDAANLDTLVIKLVTLTQSKDFVSLGLAFTIYTQPGAAEIAGPASAPAMSLSQAVMDERARLRATVEQSWSQGGWELVISVLKALRDPGVPSDPLDSLLYQAYIAHGRDLIDAGKTDKALAEYQAALTLRSDGTEARDGLRRAQEASGGR